LAFKVTVVTQSSYTRKDTYILSILKTNKIKICKSFLCSINL